MHAPSHRLVVALTVAASCTACSWMNTPHATLHPTRQADATGAGVAVGLFMPIQETSQNQRMIGLTPYGEGWARFGLGPGQLELRITPTMGFASFRLPVLDDPKMPITLDVIPSLGLGFFFYGASSAGADIRGFIFGPGFTALASTVDRKFYFAARGGVLFQHLGLPTGGFGGGSTSSDAGIFTFGLTVGYRLSLGAFEPTFEIAWQRQAFTAASALGLTGATMHILALTVGINFGSSPSLSPEAPPKEPDLATLPEKPGAKKADKPQAYAKKAEATAKAEEKATPEEPKKRKKLKKRGKEKPKDEAKFDDLFGEQ